MPKVLEAPPRRRKTARKAASKPLPELPAEAADAAMTELAAIATSTSAIADAQRLQLAVLHTCLQPRASFVSQPSPTREQLQITCVRGRNDPRISAVIPGEGPVGRAFSEGHSVAEEGLVSVPVVGQTGTLGCVTLLGARFAARESLWSALSAQIATAWEVARVKDDAQRREKDLQTAVAGLKSLERNREELLSNVSHDFKNPLTTIKAYLTMLSLQRLGPLSEEQQRATNTCERNADRLLRLINDLMLISRLQSGQMQLHQRPFGLKALAEEASRVLTALAERGRVRVLFPPCSEVFVRGDRDRVFEAIANLIENAILHSPEKSEVELSVATHEGLAELSITDRGIGISEEELPRLFDAFYRSHARAAGHQVGGGLGLPIAARIAQLHGGRIRARSRLGRGSTFTLALPMFASAVGPARSEDSAPRGGGILLVEDDVDCREVLKEVLELQGYQVVATAGAKEAREVLGQMKPAMVLLDLRLAREDGRSVLHHIRGDARLADTAVYLMSGSSEVASLASGQGLDRVEGFFEKPLQLPKLLDEVAAVVRPAHAPAPSE